MHFVVAPRSQVHAFQFQLAHFNGQKDPMEKPTKSNGGWSREKCIDCAGRSSFVSMAIPITECERCTLVSWECAMTPCFTLHLFLSRSLHSIIFPLNLNENQTEAGPLGNIIFKSLISLIEVFAYGFSSSLLLLSLFIPNYISSLWK